jgi:hypothetical protein
MFGELSAVSGTDLHVFTRNAGALARAWYGRVDPEEEAVIRGICGGLVERYYGSWKQG